MQNPANPRRNEAAIKFLTELTPTVTSKRQRRYFKIKILSENFSSYAFTVEKRITELQRPNTAEAASDTESTKLSDTPIFRLFDNGFKSSGFKNNRNERAIKNEAAMCENKSIYPILWEE